VGSFGSYGYGIADMAGNVWEWASNILGDDSITCCGGSWYDDHIPYLEVTGRVIGTKSSLAGNHGFRVVREAEDMEWVSINDPGFNGRMSKYETTNAQYCRSGEVYFRRDR
jgi:hypothetical protein